ncbi:hypothetical protein N7528_008677 [Penicillium herquei]|nr:hypothetical protein N7528_008677 [Penicillium herquei]
MPPKRTVSAEKDGNQEGRILLAIQAIKNDQITSIREAARRFNVPFTSLHRRLNGHINRSETRANNHKLNENKEKSLLQWVISMDICGATPRPATVQEMANILLVTRGQVPSQTIGKNWVTNFSLLYGSLDNIITNVTTIKTISGARRVLPPVKFLSKVSLKTFYLIGDLKLKHVNYVLHIKSKSKSIPNEGSITVQKGQEAIQRAIQVVETPVIPPVPRPRAPILPPQPARRKLPTCKKCGEEGHRSDHCDI